MQAGELRERVTFLAKTSTTDSQGGRSDVWAALTTTPTVWASVTPVPAGEQVQATALEAMTTYRVVVRYRADLTAQMRAQWTPYLATAARTLEVHGLAPVGADRAFLALDCGSVA